ncbi:hydroxymethylbilane synthase [Arthrobacter castelli]|uniref:hydroxymethylbilane synthase n=1 Tax=Arthrobacter castelli TaxID=271431 RepID=UPI00041E1251|nr:hydroxymethylbilane synthase [Arthrobacter castelli]
MSGSKPTVRFGTRGSSLAMTQTSAAAEELADHGGFDVELVTVKTQGDEFKGSLTQIGGTGVFVTALRDSLLRGDCDIAVHSLKDLPTEAAQDLDIAAIPPRVDHRDALCARNNLTLAELEPGSKVGTGSPRRGAQILAARPDLEVVDIRGNVGTRLGRVAPGDLDAVVLAAAGLQRLELQDAVTEYLDPSVMLPAPAQGALALECRSETNTDRSMVGKALAAYDDAATRLPVTAERSVLARLEAGCTAPIGALGHLGQGRLSLDAVVCKPDGSRIIRQSAATGDTSAAGAAALGVLLAEKLLDAGAAGLTPLAE